MLIITNRYLAVWICALLLVGGCGEEVPQKYQVAGMVTFRDKVVPTGSITFAPRGGGKLVVTAIGQDGSYRLEALPGTYQVGVASVAEVAAGKAGFEQRTQPSMLPDWYSYPGRSGIEVTVEEKEENVFDISLRKVIEPVRGKR